MSLFTGTVLAVPANPSMTTFTITAGTASKEFKLDGWAASTEKVDYTIFSTRTGSGPYVYATADAVQAETGITVGTDDSITINTSNLLTTTPNTVFYLVITKADNTIHEVVINVRYTLTINGSTTAPKLNLNESTTLTGTLMNNGVAVKNTVISFKSGATVLGLTTTGPDGSFNMVVTVTAAAAYDICVGPITTPPTEVPYYTASFNVVENIDVAVTTKPATLRSGTNNAVFTFTPKTDTTALTGDLTDHNLVNVTTPDGYVFTGRFTTSPYTVTIADLRTGTTPTLKAGTYKVDVVLYLNSVAAETLISESSTYKPYASGTNTFTIVDNTNELYVDASVDHDNNVTTPAKTSNLPVQVAAQNEVLSFTAPGAKLIKSVTYTIAGPLKATVTNTKTLAGTLADPFVATLAVTPKSFVIIGEGVVTISGTVTYSTDTTDTFTKTFSVKGYNAEYLPAVIGSVGQEVELKVTVTNEAGAPVNNAIVTWAAHAYNLPTTPPVTPAFKVWDTTLDPDAYGAPTDTTYVSGQTTLIQNGVYSAKVKLLAPAEIFITVTGNDGGAFLASYTTQRVTGSPVYTVAAPADLVAAKPAQTLSLQMKNADGVIVAPDYAYIEDLNNLVGGNKEFAPALTPANPVTYDTVKKAATFTLTTAAKTGTFTVYLGTDLGNKMVAVPVNVVSPAVTVTVNGLVSKTVTAGKLDTIELTFADKTSAIVIQTITAADYKDAVCAAPVISTVVSGVGTVKMNTQLVGTKKTGTVDLYATFNAGAAVKVATITVLPPVLDLGGVTELQISDGIDLNLTFTDANGVAIKDQVITPSGAVLVGTTVKTDVDGKAVLTLSPNTVGNLTLTATGFVSSNTPADFSVAIPVVRDTKGPVFTMDAVYTVSTLPAVISFDVTDGSKVSEVWVGYEKAMVRPDGSVIFTVSNLSVGENTFDVLAYDIYGNASEAVLTIEYLKPATVVLTIGSLDATKDGAAMTGMDQAPVIVNGRTFLPVRFVFESLLNGTVSWNQATQTVTSFVRGNTIQMVIGSKIAVVNGVDVSLLEAPYVAAATNRTLVPMREIMEAIGVTLDWNAVTQTVTLVIPQ